MENIYKTYIHNPPHLYVDDSYYMITAAVYQKRPFLSADWSKEVLLEIIQEFSAKVRWQVIEWVILDNHYHMILRSRFGKNLPRLMGGIHRKSANIIKKQRKLVCKRFWWNYWDTCPKGERQLYATRNYVNYNPVKHRIVEDLKDYPWSSFSMNLEISGRYSIEYRFRKYPFKDLRIKDDF